MDAPHRDAELPDTRTDELPASLEGGDVKSDFDLARSWTSVHRLRLAEGPDPVHRHSITRIELKRRRERAGSEI